MASLITNRKEALIHKTGSPEEMAALCKEILDNNALKEELKKGARQFAEKYFNYQQKVDQLEELYYIAINQFSKNKSEIFWKENSKEKFLLTQFIKKINHLLKVTNGEKLQISIINYLIKVISSLQERLVVRDQQVEELENRKRSKLFWLYKIIKNILHMYIF